MRAFIVVDLGFGDSGKGLLTDFLVRHLGAEVVVRYNGGAQAGHNVVTPEGHQHTFSQFGSGTFLPHVKTYLSRHVVIHPMALLLEGDVLAGKGVQEPFSRLRVSDQALVITPFHQATNRIRELVRGANRHGSCGVGVGEAVEDSLVSPENTVLAGDLKDPVVLRKKLHEIRRKKQEQIRKLFKNHSPGPLLIQEYQVFQREDIINTWIAAVARIHDLGLVVPDTVLERWLQETENAIFEGAQGVLLDAEAGFHPYTTWSRCTASNAFDLIQQLVPDAEVVQIGILRSYAVRHGPGPLPTETEAFRSALAEHNEYNEWQGPVRYGWFDAVLARYALSVATGVDFLAVTHLDVLQQWTTWKYGLAYEAASIMFDKSVPATMDRGILTGFHPPASLSLVERAQLTQALFGAKPVFATCTADDETVIRKIETLLGRPVGMVSHGPSAENVEIAASFPFARRS